MHHLCHSICEYLCSIISTINFLYSRGKIHSDVGPLASGYRKGIQKSSRWPIIRLRLPAPIPGLDTFLDTLPHSIPCKAPELCSYIMKRPRRILCQAAATCEPECQNCDWTIVENQPCGSYYPEEQPLTCSYLEASTTETSVRI